MEFVRLLTPEWLEISAEFYRSTPKFKNEFNRLSVNICFQFTAEPDWGIDKDLTYGAFVEKGELLRLEFFSEQDAKSESEFILSATPQEWKKILRKENKFITDFMLGRITLPHGSKPGILKVAPHANSFVDALTSVEIKYPDEMSQDELEEYRDYVQSFRSELGV